MFQLPLKLWILVQLRVCIATVLSTSNVATVYVPSLGRKSCRVCSCFMCGCFYPSFCTSDVDL